MKNLLTHKGTNQYKRRIRFTPQPDFQLTRIGRNDFILAAIFIYVITVIAVHGKVEQAWERATSHMDLVKVAHAEEKMPELAPQPEYDRTVHLIRYYFGKDADAAIQVFRCESGLRTEAMNTHNSDGFPDVGIAQIHVTDRSPFSVDEMKNPIANLLQAKKMFEERGWQPWESSNSCHHMWKGGDTN